jgi:hypothetical protein
MAASLTFGPIYCEDAIALSSFPIEPVNTVSNAAIVIFGLASLYVTTKRAPKSYDLYALGLLLTATGIGSGLWHGLREPWALAFDVTPGLFFLFAFAFCWARRLWTIIGGLALLVAFYFAFQFSREYFGAFQQRWVAIAPAVVLTGIALVIQTAFRSKTAALLGLGAILSSLTALGWRTFDMTACDYLPFGTHFLWHIFNSAGAFMGVLSLITLEQASVRIPRAQPIPVQEAAE